MANNTRITKEQLNKLEKRIDKMLEKETPESLNKYLADKRALAKERQAKSGVSDIDMLNEIRGGKIPVPTASYLQGIKPKRAKYGNQKTVVDGMTFDSKKEANRYIELLSLTKLPGNDRNKIFDLRCQVPYDIIVCEKHICNYIADFVYQAQNGCEVVEDVKSEATRKLPVYRLKRKLLKAIYNLDIIEI